MDLRQSFILLLILTLLSKRTLSMRYELKSAQTKCIGEDIHAKSMSVGKYSIVNLNEDHPLPDTHKIIVKLMSPNGTMVHEGHIVESGQFSFTAKESGNYIACISAFDHNPDTVLTIDFNWKTGVHSKEWSNVAKRSQVDMVEKQVKHLMETVGSIREEMFYLREREEEMQELNRSTNSKMAWLSLVSLGFCLSVAGVQFWHLKSFFQKKKLMGKRLKTDCTIVNRENYSLVNETVPPKSSI